MIPQSSAVCALAVTASSKDVCVRARAHICTLRLVWLFGTPWNVACWAPLSTGFPRIPGYWSSLPFPPPGAPPHPGIKPASLTSPSLPVFTAEPARKPKELHTARTVQRKNERPKEAALEVGKHHAGEDLDSDPRRPLTSHVLWASLPPALLVVSIISTCQISGGGGRK